jgi:hypothetical protein
MNRQRRAKLKVIALEDGTYGPLGGLACHSILG